MRRFACPRPSPNSEPQSESWRHRRHYRWVGVVAALSILLGSIALPSAAGQAQAGVVFDESLAAGYGDWSWSGATIDLAATEQASTGTISIGADLAPHRALSLGRSVPAVAPVDGQLSFAVHGGANQTVSLRVAAMDATFATGPTVPIEVPGGQWTTFSIPLADLGSPSAIAGFWWQEAAGADPAVVFVDDIAVVDDSEPIDDPVDRPVDEPTSAWAFEETFDGDPAAPSQDLLPTNFDYAVTHRSHPKDHFDPYPAFLADHADNCAGPNPEIIPLPQHLVTTRQDSNGTNPDDSFFICKNHMMSSMGQAGPYSVSAFWPKQEFNFADGGVLEFEVNINDAHDVRSWWEVMIVPRDQLRVASGPQDSPISERYPDDHIVLDFRRNVRTVKVASEELAQTGQAIDETQWGQYREAWWRDLYEFDPALDDRRERRTMRISFEPQRILWGIETEDGTFDEWSVDVPGGLPFDQGLVLFKTHAYNPVKDGNTDTYTFHWDNIRFDGPVVGTYQTDDASDVVYLQRNGDRTVGESQTVTIDVDQLGANPVLFGQIHQPKRGSVLLSINGGEPFQVDPAEYERDDCASDHWVSFQLPLDASQLRLGENTFTWTVGPKPACATGPIDWIGYSVKFLQLQSDLP